MTNSRGTSSLKLRKVNDPSLKMHLEFWRTTLRLLHKKSDYLLICLQKKKSACTAPQEGKKKFVLTNCQIFPFGNPNNCFLKEQFSFLCISLYFHIFIPPKEMNISSIQEIRKQFPIEKKVRQTLYRSSRSCFLKSCNTKRRRASKEWLDTTHQLHQKRPFLVPKDLRVLTIQIGCLYILSVYILSVVKSRESVFLSASLAQRALDIDFRRRRRQNKKARDFIKYR